MPQYDINGYRRFYEEKRADDRSPTEKLHTAIKWSVVLYSSET